MGMTGVKTALIDGVSPLRHRLGGPGEAAICSAHPLSRRDESSLPLPRLGLRSKHSFNDQASIPNAALTPDGATLSDRLGLPGLGSVDEIFHESSNPAPGHCSGSSAGGHLPALSLIPLVAPGKAFRTGLRNILPSQPRGITTIESYGLPNPFSWSTTCPPSRPFLWRRP